MSFLKMNGLEIRQPYIKRKGNKSRLCSDVTWGDRRRTLWFEVENEYAECFCAERIDGFLVALLPFAMMENLNIHSDGYVSEKLLYHLKTILLPSLSANIKEYHPIIVDARCDGRILDSKHGVATGLSCGVDSFYTVLKHLNTEMERFRLTHLTYFNIMNSPYWTDLLDSSREFSNARIKYIQPVVKELGLKLVTVDSNFDRFYNRHHLLATFTFRYFGTVLALQKLFEKYYWSSADSFAHFSFSIESIATFDLLSVQCVSNENTTFYSTGSEVTRLEKTEYISDFDITYKYLYVCWFDLYNCGKCDKCRRTMLSLYALGKLDRYGALFDVDYFYQNKNEYLGHMFHKMIAERHHGYYGEIYKCLTQQNIKIPVAAKMHAIKLINRAIKERLKKL